MKRQYLKQDQSSIIVFQHIADGIPIKQISSKLNRTDRGIEAIIEKTRAKIEAVSTSHAVAILMRNKKIK